jgi:hypothetical protein
MDLLNHPTAASGLYTDGNPGTGLAATVLHAEAMNALLLETYNAIDAAGIEHDREDLTQLTQAIRTLGVGIGGLKNAVINADFDVWQRGESFASVGVAEKYTADRWAIVGDGAAGAGLALITRQGFAVGEPLVPGARSFLRYQQTVASTAGGGRIRHKIEGLERFADTTVSVSLYLKTGSTLAASVRLVYVFGQGSTSQAASESVAITSTWQQFTFSVDMPSVVGQTMSHTTAHLMLEIVLPQGSPTVDVARVQVERSQLPSGFEFRPAGLELDLCRRYFEKSYEPTTAPGTVTRKGISIGIGQATEVNPLSTRFAVAKRALPTIRWYDPEELDAVNTIFQPNLAVQHEVTQTMEIAHTATGWPVIGTTIPSLTRFWAHWTADAEL